MWEQRLKKNVQKIQNKREWKPTNEIFLICNFKIKGHNC